MWPVLSCWYGAIGGEKLTISALLLVSRRNVVTLVYRVAQKKRGHPISLQIF